MKKNSLHRISTEITSDKIKIVNDIDLNALFNLNYNFDLLKGIIETLLKNQGSLQKQLDELYSSNEDKDKIIQDLEADIKSLRETKVNINDFNEIKPEIEQINNHLKQNDKKIEECKFIIFIT
jgi:uncharacterized coiled-coil DUF342 family protein